MDSKGGRFNTEPLYLCNSKYVVIGCGRIIKTISVETGRTLNVIKENNNRIVNLHRVGFSESEKTFISTTNDSWIKLWNKWKVEGEIKESSSPRKPNGIVVFILNKEGKLLRCKLEPGSITQTEYSKKKRNFPRSLVGRFIIPNNESKFITCNKKSLVVYDIRKQSAFTKIQNENITCFTYNEKSNSVAVGLESGKVVLFFLNSKTFSTFHWHPVPCRYLQYSENGKYLYSTGDSGILLTTNVYESKEKRYCFIKQKIKTFKVSTEQNHYSLVTDTNELIFVDPTKFKYHSGMKGITHEIGGLSLGNKMCVIPESNIIIPYGATQMEEVGGDGGKRKKIQFYDLKKDTEVQKLVVYRPQNSFDPKTNQWTRTVNVSINSVAVSPYREFLVHHETRCWSKDNIDNVTYLRVWKKRSVGNMYDQISQIENSHGNCMVNHIQFHPTTKNCFITSGNDGSVKVWNNEELNIFKCFSILKFKNKSAKHFDISRNGKLVFTLFDDFLVVWDGKIYKKEWEILIGSETNKFLEVREVLNNCVVVGSTRAIILVDCKKRMMVSEIRVPVGLNLSGLIRNLELSNSIVAKFFASEVLMSINMSTLSIKYFKVSENVVDASFLSEKEIIVMSPNCRLYFINTEKREEVIEKENTPEVIIKEFPIQKIEKEDGSQETVKSSLEYKISSFDPDLGSEAWKDLFDVTSHTLPTMSTMFETYMDTLILKNKD